MYISKTFQKNVIAFSEQIKMEFIFLERQFERVKEGDRFFFTHKDEAGSFTTAAKEIFLGRTLSGVICDNTEITSVPRDAFAYTSTDKYEDCSNTIKLDDNDIAELLKFTSDLRN